VIVCFVGVGGIVDHQCLNFLFITCSNVAAMIFGWIYNQLPLLLKFVNLKGVHCLDQCVVFTVHCIIDNERVFIV
jgi:hypothetical protein